MDTFKQQSNRWKEMQNNLIERLEKCYTGAVYDVLRERGNKNTNSVFFII